MSDYTPTQTYVGKDSLSVGDPEKLVLGSDLDLEFSAIQTASATKYDISDLATQAQAETATNNTQFMTPLRVSQYVNQNAGVIADLIALTDPGADRILFWDESVNTIKFLTISTGLSISGTSITTNDSAILHDSLSGFVSNEHIDHTSVTITAGVGLSWSTGGTDISTNATLDLDINELTTETTIDIAADYIAVYDASASVERKFLASTFVGAALGDGKWYRSSTVAISTSEVTIAFNAAEYDSLQLGTFNTTTGEYTRGSTAGRVQVTTQISISNQPVDTGCTGKIQQAGTTKAQAGSIHFTGVGATTRHITMTVTLNLSASQVVRVRMVTSSGAMTVGAGTHLTYVSIVELS